MRVDSLPMLVPKDNVSLSASFELPSCQGPHTLSRLPLRIHPLLNNTTPTHPPQQVLVRVHAVGVNPVETYIRAGTYAKMPDTFPYTPGNDASGVVEAVGSLVTSVRPGDRVFTLKCETGAYAEVALADAAFVRPLPAQASFAQGAALPVPYFTAHRALFAKAHLKPGQTVLVHGATGAVGIACLQMARRHGCTVIGSAGTDAGAAVIAPLCHTVVRHGARGSDEEPGGIVDQVLLATSGKGVDVICEMLANENLGHDLRMLAQGGTVAVIGSRGAVQITPRELMAREASIVGVMLWHATESDFAEAGAYIHNGLVDGTLKPVVGPVFKGLEAAPAAHEDVMAHHGGSAGKVVIEVVAAEQG
jgi:NADPH2:quinone reductase